MAEQVQRLSQEAHIFRLTLSFQVSGPTKMVVVSYDGSIVYVMDADHWIKEFPSGSNKIYVDGYYDLLDCNIYLGKLRNDQDW